MRNETDEIKKGDWIVTVIVGVRFFFFIQKNSLAFVNKTIETDGLIDELESTDVLKVTVATDGKVT